MTSSGGSRHAVALESGVAAVAERGKSDPNGFGRNPNPECRHREHMQLHSAVTGRPGLVAAGLCSMIGFLTGGTDAAVLWALVGYFAGKSIQSVVWTWTGGPSA